MPEECEHDHWAPIPLRWRHVIAGDVLVGKGKPLMVQDICDGVAGINVVLYGYLQPFRVDPDETVQVLVPAAEREAIREVREQLGGRIMDGRKAS